jgi:hypothetical protein
MSKVYNDALTIHQNIINSPDFIMLQQTLKEQENIKKTGGQHRQSQSMENTD